MDVCSTVQRTLAIGSGQFMEVESVNAIHAKLALLPDGWASDVRIGIGDGKISSVEAGIAAPAGGEHHAAVVPGMPNVHSHAFQRGMAGLAEVRGPAADSFWTWRDLMYRFALTMSPGQMEAVASQAYVEMLESGFTRVGEFHYLHHDSDGSPYANVAEMASRIAAASERTGISLTLLPVFYAHGNFGGAESSPAQRRFVTDLDGFAHLFEASNHAIAALDGAGIGLAPHSLRAVTAEELAAIVAILPHGPIHIHVAEQEREVVDCLAWSGQRPVEWLLDHAEVDHRWSLIHGTHLTDRETARMAASGAVAGLCPVTEANLGDGIFRTREFLGVGGQFGIGTDSNIRISVTDELRQLEYAQRLTHRQRNVLVGESSTGLTLFEAALRGGQRALGVQSAGIVAGAPANIVSLSTDLWKGADGDDILNAWIFAHCVDVDCVWVAGRKLVEGGRHIHRDKIVRLFRTTMHELLADS